MVQEAIVARPMDMVSHPHILHTPRSQMGATIRPTTAAQWPLPSQITDLNPTWNRSTRELCPDLPGLWVPQHYLPLNR